MYIENVFNPYISSMTIDDWLHTIMQSSVHCFAKRDIDYHVRYRRENIKYLLLE